MNARYENDCLDEICKLIPPPDFPNAIGDINAWCKVEEELGFCLPIDYKRLITVYGSGRFNHDIFVANPFVKGAFNLVEEYRRFNRMGGYISENNLVPFVFGICNDFFCWQLDELNRISEIVTTIGTCEADRCFEKSITELLLGLLTGEVQCLAVGEDFSEYRIFEVF